jgi:F-type H+-transporting ATPase subunit gamma
MAGETMTSQRDLRARLQKLHDLREILASMKNLAYMETRKLLPRLASQQEAVRLVESAASDFLAHFLAVAETPAPAEEMLIVIGSERGFCGGFNERLVDVLGAANPTRLIAVGRKLAAKFEGDPRLRGATEGAIVAEDAEAIIDVLVRTLGAKGAVGLTLLFHGEDHDEDSQLQRLSLLPPFRQLALPTPPQPVPPQLNLPPRDFFLERVDHYLFAVLHQVLFASLLAENQQRVRHLEGAVQRLDEQLASLERRRHQLRQQEIVAEIEVILLNAELSA